LEKNLEDNQQFVKEATCPFEKSIFLPKSRKRRGKREEGGREGGRQAAEIFVLEPHPKHKAGGIFNQLQQV
jgi:hypothetical protein